MKRMLATTAFVMTVMLTVTLSADHLAARSLNNFKTVSVGGLDFAIPEPSSKEIVYMKDANGDVARGKNLPDCLNLQDVSCPLQTLALQPPLEFFPEILESNDTASGNRGGFTTHVSLSSFPHPWQPTDAYDHYFEMGLFNPKEDVSSRPEENGFKVYSFFNKSRKTGAESKENNYKAGLYFLVPVEKEFRTPNGNPVVFLCHHLSSGPSAPQSCHTRIAWKPGVQLAITHIHSSWVTNDDLFRFYRQVLDYLDKRRARASK